MGREFCRISRDGRLTLVIETYSALRALLIRLKVLSTISMQLSKICVNPNICRAIRAWGSRCPVVPEQTV